MYNYSDCEPDSTNSETVHRLLSAIYCFNSPDIFIYRDLLSPILTCSKPVLGMKIIEFFVIVNCCWMDIGVLSL